MTFFIKVFLTIYSPIALIYHVLSPYISYPKLKPYIKMHVERDKEKKPIHIFQLQSSSNYIWCILIHATNMPKNQQYAKCMTFYTKITL